MLTSTDATDQVISDYCSCVELALCALLRLMQHFVC